jgi:predicted regulator of Ras-like GTPase activity (Roadblock/LC7/MglB family)
MANDGPDSNPDLGWLLEDLVTRVPHTRGAVLLSADGLARAACGLDRDRADQLAVIAASLFSTGKAAGTVLGGRSEVRQVAVELAGALLFVSSAGESGSSVLAVTAGREADPQLVGYEMAQLVKSVQPFLAIPARPPGAGPGQRTPARTANPGRRHQ